MSRRGTLAMLLALLGLVTVLAVGCGGDSGSDAQAADPAGDAGDAATLGLVAYSTPREVYEELIPAFQDTDAGERRRVRAVVRASGEQSRAVEAGLPADYVAFSLEPDVTRLVDAGLVAPDWASDRAVRRHGLELGRRLRRSRGEPEGHPDLGRPRHAARSR